MSFLHSHKHSQTTSSIYIAQCIKSIVWKNSQWGFGKGVAPAKRITFHARDRSILKYAFPASVDALQHFQIATSEVFFPKNPFVCPFWKGSPLHSCSRDRIGTLHPIRKGGIGILRVWKKWRLEQKRTSWLVTLKISDFGGGCRQKVWNMSIIGRDISL